MNPPSPRPIVLSPVELLGCWTAAGLGEMPTQLWVRPPGATVEDSARLLTEAVAGLAARGLSDGHRLHPRPHPVLAGLLRAIADSEFMVDIRLSDSAGGAAAVLGLGAVAGAHGVTLVTRDGVEGLVAPMELAAMDATRVTGALLGLVSLAGPIRPGVGAPVNIPAEALDSAVRSAPDGDLWAVADRLVAQRVPAREAHSLARMCTGIEVAGQLGATGRPGPFHREHRADRVVGFHRTARGWFVQLRRVGVVSVHPPDPTRLLRQWQDLITTVRYPAQH